MGATGDLHHLVDEAVVAGLARREPAVAVGVLLDLLDRLAGVVRGPLEQRLLDVQHLLGLDLDVGRGAADAAGDMIPLQQIIRDAEPHRIA